MSYQGQSLTLKPKKTEERSTFLVNPRPSNSAELSIGTKALGDFNQGGDSVPSSVGQDFKRTSVLNDTRRPGFAGGTQSAVTYRLCRKQGSVARLWAAMLALVVLPITGQQNAAAQFILGTPLILDHPVETSINELNPELSADGLTLYFQRGNYIEGPELWVATRESINDAWNEPRPLDEINTSQGEAAPALSPNEMELYFSDAHRPGHAEPLRPGGMGGPDIWLSLWDQENGVWAEPRNAGTPISTQYRDYGPNLSADGLELYFSSDRPGGLGDADLWVATRPTISAPWGEPTLIPNVNSSSHDEAPALSPDGRTLVLGSNRLGSVGRSSLWVTTRDRVDGDWGTPVPLSKLDGGDWTYGPDFSPDGTTMIYGRWESDLLGTMWEVELLPLEYMSIEPGASYTQDFDKALTASAAAGSPFPTGWTASNNDVVYDNATTESFPATRRIQSGSIFSAGTEQDTDRALAIGATRRTSRNAPEAPMLQFLTEVEERDAVALQLQFDLEAWDAARAEVPGEAAFDVSLEMDSGEGFSPLYDFGVVTTGAVLSEPEGESLDGNLDANRTTFDSGVLTADIPVGAALRFRWRAPESAAIGGWVFGLDDVTITLHSNLVEAFDCNRDGLLDVFDADCATSASLTGMLSAVNLVQGDADGDGKVQFSDFLILSENFGTPGKYTDGDFDKDGEVQFGDFLVLSQNFGQSAGTAAAVPEPSGVLVTILGAVAMIGARRQPISRLD